MLQSNDCPNSGGRKIPNDMCHIMQLSQTEGCDTQIVEEGLGRRTVNDQS